VPASVNVNWKVWPMIRSPESKRPVSDVTVCVTLSWFTQQTVVPGGTVSSAGSNWKLEMLTWTAFRSQFGGGGPAGAPLIAGALPTSAQTATASVNAARCRTLTSSPR
jgi:hypothetical protein